MGFKNSLFYGTILHSACLSKNVELVKHLIQTQSIDINTKNVFYLYFNDILYVYVFNFVFFFIENVMAF